MIQIPPNKTWSQNPRSDVLGSLRNSFNADFTTNEGHTRISPRTIITTDDIANLGVAVGFVRFNNSTNGNGFYTIAGDRIFNTDTVDPTDNFVESTDNDTGFTSDTANILLFKKANKVAFTKDTALDNLATTGGMATVGAFSLVGGTVHMMCEYGARLYITDNYNKIYSANTSFTTASSGANTLSLGTVDSNYVDLIITDIQSDSSKIWIFTIALGYGEFARIFTWDGATADTPTNSQGYPLDCGGVVAAIIKDDTPYIITTEAELMVFNGGSFVRVPNGKLPVNPNKFLKNTFSSINNRWIHPRGMIITPEGKINILINNLYEDNTYEERLPSGIWEFDLHNTALGWYHKYSISLYASSITDFGQNLISRVGALSYVKTPGKEGLLLGGAQIYSDATTTKEVIFRIDTADTIQKYGYFVTDKIYSANVMDMWQKAYPRFKKFLTATDKLVLKYRSDDPEPTNITITWTSTTTFTTTTDVSALVGYEVEVLQGKGSGLCSHISSVSDLGGGTYEVTVDETYTGCTSGTAKARVQNWTKAGSYSAQTDNYAKFTIDNASTYIELKVCLLSTGKNEIDDVLLTNKPQIPAV